MDGQHFINAQAQYLYRKSLRASNNGFLWSTVHNITGILGCAMPFVLIAMYGKIVPKSTPLAMSLALAWPVHYLINANQRALWSYKDHYHFQACATMVECKTKKRRSKFA